MKDSTKKRLVIAGLAVVCVLAIFGISRVLYKEPEQTLDMESKAEEDVELMIESGESTGDVEKEAANEEESKELVIEPETENGVESGEQVIQPDPEKTEEEKPTEPPAVSEESDVTNPDTEPTYEEPEEKPQESAPPAGDGTPSHGDTKDGMIYIDGFGWVPDNGGGGSGTVADDMYENGNKVGIMD